MNIILVPLSCPYLTGLHYTPRKIIKVHPLRKKYFCRNTWNPLHILTQFPHPHRNRVLCTMFLCFAAIKCKILLWTLLAGLHKLWYPGIRDRSTWGKFGAHGEHGDVFLFSNLGALWFSENLIRFSLHVCLREVKNNLFSFKHSYLRHFSWRF